MKFNVNNGVGSWACQHGKSARMKPFVVTRREFCGDCEFDYKKSGCLFEPPKSVAELPHNNPGVARAHRESRAKELRRQGLNSRGGPLSPTCWNCDNIRWNGTHFVCRFHLLERPRTKTQIYQARVIDCQDYVMRLGDVQDV